MKFIRIITRYKIYIDRARTYVGTFQFLMLAVILAKQFGIRLGIAGTVLLVVGFIAACLLIGYLDTKFGIRGEEQNNYTEQNKLLMEMYNKLKNESSINSINPRT